MSQFDVEAFIDRQKIGPRQILILAICTLFCFIDGFDIFMIGKIAPAIAEGFDEPPAAMTQLFLYQQIGLAVGAFLVAPLGDRFGRRTMLVVSAILFGTLSLVSIWAQSLHQLSILRGVGGIFMSAGLPLAVALIAETTPKPRRATFIAIAMAGYSTGSAASGAVAAFLLDDYGWQSAFWIAGLVPLLCVPLLLLFVPESIKFRTERNARDPAIARTIARLYPAADLTGVDSFALGTSREKPKKARLLDIFADGRGFSTTILWICCFLSMSNIALLGAWLPTFFQEMAGVPIQRFAIVAMIAFSGGFAGTLIMGYLMDRFRPAPVIACAYVVLAAALVTLGYVPFEAPLFIAVLILWSFCQSGGQSGLNTFITYAYPPRMRSTGLGWSGGAGRIGGILIAPTFGGFALQQGLTLQTTLLCVAVSPLIVAALILLLGYRQSRRPESSLQPATA
ncbi:MFS transporter [Sphingosinicella sp. CPCC 101087]|uniref:MFS transporter n=1 Tax=Sphingosinicella sp. CPCC 101087 TaxID=2497754 RepID=UPI00101DE8E3|nr:MFS transporter [Sphingosinicella sp. CPCC 101087]